MALSLVLLLGAGLLMRTLDHMRDDKRVRIAQETMEIYAPLAGRMGMQDLRDELEALSFQYINPQAFEAVTRHLSDLADSNRNLIEEISNIERKVRLISRALE